MIGITIGHNTKSTGVNSITIGSSSTGTGVHSVCIGRRYLTKEEIEIRELEKFLSKIILNMDEGK